MKSERRQEHEDCTVRSASGCQHCPGRQSAELDWYTGQRWVEKIKERNKANGERKPRPTSWQVSGGAGLKALVNAGSVYMGSVNTGLAEGEKGWVGLSLQHGPNKVWGQSLGLEVETGAKEQGDVEPRLHDMLAGQ
ncbi:hypothetical protein DPEC_G00252440 [Dallia pectoralis]|uniref:Uncharacterized protein n=1 Tax=Dallia pectoralis TaxID=75939 RepID=A0ACC2FTP3_DALPE|nr:hypothetical protein DPEC_G00252440 [Dallia pectoralis]